MPFEFLSQTRISDKPLVRFTVPRATAPAGVPHRIFVRDSLSAVRRRMDQAYADKLDGKLPEDFWARKMSDWRTEEQNIEVALHAPSDSYADRVLSAKRILELANKAYFLYVTEKPAEQAKLLRKVLSNC